jgi:DNA replicative helicase MCM subunit Mcm2 (Cdc46/Mcm family)
MGTSESENRIRKIIEGFKEQGELHSSFKNHFIQSIYRKTESLFPERDFGSELADQILLYAENIISCTESVVDKDVNYPEYRMDEEVNRMKQIIEKLPVFEHADALHKEAKKSIVKFFPAVFELSGQGFRLLELNTGFFNQGFLDNFYALNKSIDQR